MSMSQSGVLRLRVLDGVGLDGDGVEGVVAQKRLLFLTYLVLEGREAPVRREHLLTLFWPEADAERARGSLRQALFGLRAVMGDDALSARGSAELAVDPSTVSCDALEFLDAIGREDYGAASALYRSELLAGVSAGERVALEHWLEQSRDRFRRLAALAERSLARQAASNLPVRRAHLERLLELMPYDEAAAQELVMVLLELGDRPAAVARYRRFAARLRADLELEPSAALTAIVEQARRMVPATGEAPPPAERQAAPPTRAVTPATSPAALAGPVPARTPWPRRWMRGPAWLAACAVLGGLALLVSMAWRRAAPMPDASVIQVDPLMAQSEDPETAALARLATARLRGTLAAMAGFHVRDVTGADTTSEPLPRPGTVVHGGVERRAGAWVVWANVTAVESHLLLQRTEEMHPIADSAVARVIDRVAATVATRRDMTLHWGETVHRPTSYAALEAYVAGLSAARERGYDAAINRFREAWRLDSTFYIAATAAADLAGLTHRFDLVDSLATQLAPHASQMLPVERAEYQRMRALLVGDHEARLVQSRSAMALERDAPFLIDAWASDALLANRPSEALAALDRLAELGAPDLADQLPVRATSLHLLGRYREEQRAVGAALAAAPGQPQLRDFRLPGLAALGEIDSIRAFLETAAHQQDGRDLSRPSRMAGLELVAHGHEREGQALLRAGADLAVSDPASFEGTPAHRLRAALTLVEADRDGDAERVLSTLQPRTGTFGINERSTWLMIHGILAARRGERARAAAYADSLALTTAAWRFGLETYYRARIAATLGEAERAVDLLEQSQREGMLGRRELHADIFLRPLWGNARFRRFLAVRG